MAQEIKKSPAASLAGVVDDKYLSSITVLNVGSSRLVTLTNNVTSYLASSIDNFSQAGRDLTEISEKKLYEFAGCSDVFEFAAKVWDLKATSVKNYMAVFAKFGKEIGYNFTSKWKGYNFTQLVELLPVADDTKVISEYSPKMTIKEIRAKKYVDQLSDSEKTIESLLQKGFMDAFASFLDVKGMKQEYKAKYTPVNLKKDTKSSLVFTMGAGNIKIERYGSPAHLFTFRFDTPNRYWSSSEFDTVGELLALLNSDNFKEFIAIAYKKVKSEVAPAVAEVVEEAKAKKAAEPKPTLSNDKKREEYVADLSHWQKIGEIKDVAKNCDVAYFRFDKNPDFIALHINGHLNQYVRVQADYKDKTKNILASNSMGDIVDWLKDKKI